MLPFVNPLKHNDNFNSDDSPMTRVRQVPIALFLIALLLAAGCLDPVRADDMRARTPDADAKRLVDEVLRKAGGNGAESLGEWTRSILDRALKGAGEAVRQTVPRSRLGGRDRSGGAGAPLPAERLAGALATGRPATAEILVFTSLSVPAAAWRQWLQDAARVGAPLVLRGVGEGGLRATAREIGARLGGAEAGVAIDPRLFRLFGVTRVPAVVVVPGGVPPCRSRGCMNDPAPPHDLVTGNIGLAAALEAVGEEGSAARDAARGHLRRLRGEDRP